MKELGLEHIYCRCCTEESLAMIDERVECLLIKPSGDSEVVKIESDEFQLTIRKEYKLDGSLEREYLNVNVMCFALEKNNTINEYLVADSIGLTNEEILDKIEQHQLKPVHTYGERELPRPASVPISFTIE